jgi:XRE family transcriptional regulator, regulator of sulfur utilization
MITRRDMIIAVVVACATIAAVTFADSLVATPILHSSVFNWADSKPEATKYGARRQVFDSRTAILSQLEVHVTTLKPGEMPHARHHHPAEELIIVKEGSLEAVQNTTTNQAGPGAVVFEASNEYHSLRNISQAPTTYYVIKFLPPGLKDDTK